MVFRQELEPVAAQSVTARVTDMRDMQRILPDVAESQGRADAHARTEFDAKVMNAEVHLVDHGDKIELLARRSLANRRKQLIHTALGSICAPGKPADAVRYAENQ